MYKIDREGGGSKNRSLGQTQALKLKIVLIVSYKIVLKQIFANDDN